MSLNAAADLLCDQVIDQAEALRVGVCRHENGCRIIDFGVKAKGGIEAGLRLARICMADQAKVSLLPSEPSTWPSPLIQVTTDHPIHACMAAQYAGWPVQHDKFFAMGSGPMRLRRGREPVLEHLGLDDQQALAVGVLECDELPSVAIGEAISEACRISPSQLTLCVAPTRSMAGTIQVVARSVETCLHKLFELKFDLTKIISAQGSAPLPPPTPDFAHGIGRTNDAILYGGRVTLWVESDDESIESIGQKIPSCASKDWGRPFANTFRDYRYDFYKVDPGLFSPAEVTIYNLTTGSGWRFGQLKPDVLSNSFGYS